MIKQALYIESSSTNPYYNLALEEFLLDHVEEDQIILYLWQNKNTIVIGKNQNSWKECKIRELENDGGFLARRLSGGGAVFHDLGNLNFTFLVPTKQYDLEKQMEVILTAVQMLGLNAEKSGRNDITVDGRKFSGNAFLERNGKSYHHGTLMVNVVLKDMQKYLNVDMEKLKSKSVDSVRARVANLTEFDSEITIEKSKEKLLDAFGSVYGIVPKTYELTENSEQSIRDREIRFASWEFKYGKKIEFQFEASTRFEWGDISMQIRVESGKIQDVVLYSDAMQQEVIEKIAILLIGQKFDKKVLAECLDQYLGRNEIEGKMIKDIRTFIMMQNI